MKTLPSGQSAGRTIMHVDMDAFYASVEQRDRPELAGKPVIVGADPQNGRGRGVVSAASYEARAFGVHSALPISVAYRRCPHGHFLPVRGKRYAGVSRSIMAIFHDYTPLVEPISLDEAFLDLTGSGRLLGDALRVGQEIKRRIREQERLTASVGIGPNKLIAKIASDLQKPDGFVAVEKENVRQFLDPLPVERLWGVGRKMKESLALCNLHTVADVAAYPVGMLRDRYGKAGEMIWHYAHGRDDNPVLSLRHAKSISNEITFSNDVSDTDIIRETLIMLSDKVGFRARTLNLTGRTLFLKVRFSDFSTIMRHVSLCFPTNLGETIFKESAVLLDSLSIDDRPVRLVGVGLTRLADSGHGQGDLFQCPDQKLQQLTQAVDKLRSRYGENSIRRGNRDLLKRDGTGKTPGNGDRFKLT